MKCRRSNSSSCRRNTHSLSIDGPAYAWQLTTGTAKGLAQTVPWCAALTVALSAAQHVLEEHSRQLQASRSYGDQHTATGGALPGSFINFLTDQQTRMQHTGRQDHQSYHLLSSYRMKQSKTKCMFGTSSWHPMHCVQVASPEPTGLACKAAWWHTSRSGSHI